MWARTTRAGKGRRHIEPRPSHKDLFDNRMIANASMTQEDKENEAQTAANDAEAEAKLSLQIVDNASDTSPQKRKRHDEGVPVLSPHQHDIVILEETEGGKPEETEVETETAAAGEEETEEGEEETEEGSEESACIHCGRTDDCYWKQYETELREEGELMADSSNKNIRFKLYQTVVQQIHGHLGRGNRTPTPGCVHAKVKELWPEANEQDYVGYQPA
jgi:hypothetical protein